jgi:hypothetical protein
LYHFIIDKVPRALVSNTCRPTGVTIPEEVSMQKFHLVFPRVFILMCFAAFTGNALQAQTVTVGPSGYLRDTLRQALAQPSNSPQL